MSNKTNQRVDELYPKEIQDTLTPEIERIAREAKTRQYNERIEDIKNLHSIKQQQIQDAKEDRYTHAVNTIIEWTESGKRTIPYLSFNFYYEEQQIFGRFLDKLKEANCFSSWSINPYKDAYHLEIIFSNVNIPLLQQFRDAGKIVQFPQGQTVMYLNGVLFFKLGDGTPDAINFSSAPQERKVFEAFWNLRLGKPGETEFTQEEVANIYVELHKNNPDVPISRAVSAIRKRHREKLALKERLFLTFDRIQNKWIFNVK